MQSVKNALAENLGGPAQNLAASSDQFSLDQVPSLDGKVAIVTGGSEGIGYACVNSLLKHNVSKLYILSMSKQIFDDAQKEIASEFGDATAKKVEWHQCDLSDWKATEQVASAIAKSTDRIDILINNAARGIMTRQLAESNGIDLHMAANHMGHVVFTSHLLPTLKKTASQGNTVRIVNLASNAHQNAPKDTKFESVEELNKDYGPMAQYGRTKLASILYSKYLNRHLTSAEPKILANATHPGFVETRQSTEHILEPYPVAGWAMAVGMSPLKKDIFEGAVSTMYAATTTEKGGQYICPPAVVEEGSELARDDELAERLMKLTREVVKEKAQINITDY